MQSILKWTRFIKTYIWYLLLYGAIIITYFVTKLVVTIDKRSIWIGNEYQKEAFNKSLPVSTTKSNHTMNFTSLASSDILCDDVAYLHSIQDNEEINPYITPQIKDAKYSVPVYVQSAPHNFAKREKVRRTWGSKDSYSVKTKFNFHPFFVIGTQKLNMSTSDKLLSESCRYKDMLLMPDVTDVYDNLTGKGIAAMTWMNRTFLNVTYFLKCDDDIFINIFEWGREIEMIESKRVSCFNGMCILCALWERPWVFRSGKSAISKKEYASNRYPSFCSGSSYLMTYNAMKTILEGTKQIPVFKWDDVYFTGIIADKLHIQRHDRQKLYLYLDLPKRNYFNISKKFLQVHLLKDWGYNWQALIHQEQKMLDNENNIPYDQRSM